MISSFFSYLYILDICPLWRYRVDKIIFLFCKPLLLPLDKVLCLTETFQFHEIPFTNCYSQCLSCWFSLQKVIFCSSGVSDIPLLSLLSDSVSGFMLISLSHMDLSFGQDNKYGSTFILLYAYIQVDLYHLLKMLSFFSLYF